MGYALRRDKEIADAIDSVRSRITRELSSEPYSDEDRLRLSEKVFELRALAKVERALLSGDADEATRGSLVDER